MTSEDARTNGSPKTINFIRKGYHGIVNEDFKLYLRKWIPLSILLGVTAGFGAMTFQWLLEQIWHFSYDVYDLPWYVRLFIPALGGLTAGVIISRFAKETAGGGTEEVIDAIHHKGGKIRSRVAPVKIVVSALTIGSGGSGGQEGPISQIGASMASFFGARLKLTKGEMRTFAIAGMAAGLSAVFRAPLGSAIYAIEIPYKNDVESGAVIPSMLSSVVAYLMFVPLGGYEPIFEAPSFPIALDMTIVLGIVGLGFVSGIFGRLFIFTMEFVSSVTKKSSLPFVTKIMYGGLLVGIMGAFVPEVLGLAEEEIELLVSGSITALDTLLILLAVKMVATSITIGSGGSAGVFFPSLMIGGSLGGAFANILNLHPISLFVIVGMGAMMAGVSKTPIAASVLTTEVVGGYNVLIPIMIASVVSYISTGDKTLYKNQVARRPFVYDPAALDVVSVEKVMRKDPITLSPDMTVIDARIATVHVSHYLYPIVSEEGRILGVLPRESIDRACDPATIIGDLMQTHFERVSADVSAYEAFEHMNVKQISRMLVVSPNDNCTLLGILTRIDLMEFLEHKDDIHRVY